MTVRIYIDHNSPRELELRAPNFVLLLASSLWQDWLFAVFARSRECIEIMFWSAPDLFHGMQGVTKSAYGLRRFDTN
jgi:hypothetical protein